MTGPSVKTDPLKLSRVGFRTKTSEEHEQLVEGLNALLIAYIMGSTMNEPNSASMVILKISPQ